MENLLKLMNFDTPVSPPKDEYYVLNGFIPSDIGETTFQWDHVPEMKAAGTNAFIWCKDGVWGSVVLKDYTVKENTNFIYAPLCTTYIKKTKDNVFLSDNDKGYAFLGFKKHDF